MVGTPYYLSPELCEDKPYNNKSDVWSLGVILYELCTLRHPFEANNQGALILKILKGKFLPIPQIYSRSLRNMVDALLLQDYRKRPSVQEILNSNTMQEKMKAYGYTATAESELKIKTPE